MLEPNLLKTVSKQKMAVLFVFNGHRISNLRQGFKEFPIADSYSYVLRHIL
jgi:hypothetical protein